MVVNLSDRLTLQKQHLTQHQSAMSYNKKAVLAVPMWVAAVLALSFLYLSSPEHLFAASVPPAHQTTAQWKDTDYWVHIRNVSIYDATTNTLDEDMYVLVVGNQVHKTGKVPMLIFDKDLTFNFDGEGRILMPDIVANPDSSSPDQRTEKIAEGAPANLLVIDASSVETLNRVMARPEWSDKQRRINLDEVRLILDNGWVIKDTLPRKRIDEFRLKRVKKKRQAMGLDTSSLPN